MAPFNFESIDLYSSFLQTSKALGCKKINYVMRSLYSGDVWLPRGQAFDIANALLQYIRCYMLQAHLVFEENLKYYSLIPKLHACHEIWFEMDRQLSIRNAGWILNPIVETCSVDEDFIGRAALISRSVSPRLMSLRVLNRYLAQINAMWTR